MANSLISDLAGSADYLGGPHEGRIVHQLSDGTYAVVIKGTTTQIHVFHSPDKVTWTNRGTVTIDSFATGASGKPYAACIDSANNIHIMWINSTYVGRYVKMTYAATPAWTAGTQENGIAAPGGILVHRAPAIEVLDSGVIVQACARVGDTSTTNVVMRLRARSSGGTWGTEVNVANTIGNYYTRDATRAELARDAGGASGGVQKCWFMYCPAIQDTPYLHRMLSVTIATGAIAVTTPAFNPLSSVVGYQDHGTVFSHAADRWRFAGFKPGTNGTMYVAEASSTAIISSATGTGMGRHQNDSIPPKQKISFIYLPDRIIFVGSGTAKPQGQGPGTVAIDPWLTLYGWVVSGTTWIPMEKVTVSLAGGGMLTTADNANTYILGGNDNRNQGGSEHLMVVYEAYTDKILAYAVPVPVASPSTVYTPAQGATVTTDIPNLSQSLVPAGHKVEWTLAEDSLFTVNVKTFIEDDANVDTWQNVTATHLKPIPTASMLRQGLWYMRSRLIDELGQVSAWSANQTFTVTHPPAASAVAPVGDFTKDYAGSGNVTFEWGYSDSSPVDPQTAYQIIVERNSDGAAVVDTGKVVAAGVTGTENAYGVPQVGRGSHAIGATYKDVTLQWKVRVWDSDDVVGAYSAYGLFRLSDKPTVTVTAPTEAGVADNPAPLVTWTFGASGGRLQSSFRVVITDAATAAVVYDTGTKAGATTSWAIPQPVLTLGGSYVVTVTVTDSVGLTQTDSNAFTATWTAPAVPSSIVVTATTLETNGYITVNWDENVRDVDFYAWRVYRRVTGTTNSILLLETTDTLYPIFLDWTAGSGISYQYNVVQVANRFGSLVESTSTWQTAVVGTSSYYWLLHPDDESKNIRLYQVISDDYSEEYESETLNLIGRGRKMDYGTRFGYMGTLTCEVRNTPTLTARQVKAQIETIKAEKRELFLRNPFGDIWQVGLGNLSVSRLAGVGTNEYVTLSIPYSEVS